MKLYAIRLVVALLTFAIGLVSATLSPGSRSNAVSNGKAEREVLQVEREYIQAHLNRDTAALDNILADEFTFGGRRWAESKDQRLALLESPDIDFEAINTNNVKVEVNGDSATVTGEAYTRSFQHDREITSPTYRFIRYYEQRDGRWQIVRVKIGR
jgi:Domain of unknown function (DUF4440)